MKILGMTEIAHLGLCAMPGPVACILSTNKVMKEHGGCQGSDEIRGYGRSQYREGNFLGSLVRSPLPVYVRWNGN